MKIRQALLIVVLLAPQAALAQPRDRAENRMDRREDYRDYGTNLGPGDRYEDRWDRRENRTDRRDLTGYGANYRPGYYPPSPGYYPPAPGYYPPGPGYLPAPGYPPASDYYSCEATYTVTTGRWVWNGWRWVLVKRRVVTRGRC